MLGHEEKEENEKFKYRENQNNNMAKKKKDKKKNEILGVFLFIIGIFAVIFTIPSLSKCSLSDFNFAFCLYPIILGIVGIFLIYLGFERM